MFTAQQRFGGKSRAVHPNCLFSYCLHFYEYYGTPHPFTQYTSTNLAFLDLVNEDTTISAIIQSPKHSVNNLLGDVSNLAPVVSSVSLVSTLSAYSLAF
jgi:hypothetical protein